ncbi:uncharacterized protein LOC110376264 [Helicoverpa armigera]|uniref:Kazal-like domain-containing protein n=1 Tax=Helicoverpa armigera TaxID=29058 RepID=A0A2W1C1L0_HELAM|nr:uncharacterized protein LOC110376264 [Helicoverpa armigera]PZC78003.1 hypothetical protein B5X24_HaOG202675 [Helicoverpa armigera]
MIFRKVCASLIIIGLAAEVWSHVEIEAEDYFFPLEPVINFCKMSETCTHDFVPICGQDSLGISRMFSDNCDLFEYNCDEKKQYRHVKMEVCKYELEAAAELN